MVTPFHPSKCRRYQNESRNEQSLAEMAPESRRDVGMNGLNARESHAQHRPGIQVCSSFLLPSFFSAFAEMDGREILHQNFHPSIGQTDEKMKWYSSFLPE